LSEMARSSVSSSIDLMMSARDISFPPALITGNGRAQLVPPARQEQLGRRALLGQPVQPVQPARLRAFCQSSTPSSQAGSLASRCLSPLPLALIRGQAIRRLPL
jgi:hypothetical protein